MADPGLATSPELKVEICGNMNDYSISYKIQNANTGTPSTSYLHQMSLKMSVCE